MRRSPSIVGRTLVVAALVSVSLATSSRASNAQMSPYDDELSQQLRGVHAPRISPDGRLVAYVRTTLDGNPGAHSSEVVIVNVSDRKEMSSFPGTDPRWNADATELSVIVTQNGQPGHWSRSIATGAMRFEGPASSGGAIGSGDSARTADSQFLYFLHTDGGATQLLRSDAATRDVTSVIRCACTLRALSIDSGGHTAAMIRSSITEPPDVYTVSLAGTEALKPLTRINARVVLEALMTDAETFTIVGGEQIPLQVWVLPPAGAEPGRKYPTIFSIQSDTHGNDFSDRFQLLATRGYGIVYADARGDDATFANNQRLALDAAIARFAWIDTTRIGVSETIEGNRATHTLVAVSRHFNAAVSIASLQWRRDMRFDRFLGASFTTP